MPDTIDTNWIEVSGELLSEDLISRLRNPETDVEYVRPKTFHYNGFAPQSRTDVKKALSSSWETLKEKWDSFQTLIEEQGIEEISVSTARKRWILPLLRELGFEPEYQQSAIDVHGTKYNLSHRGWEDENAPILHSVDPAQPLDEKIERQTRSSYSPHNHVQEFLNQSDDDLWALVTNGVKLRVLRDFYHEVTKGYVEFDLRQMFQDRNLDDFRALYHLAHRSRFLPGEDDDAELLEQIFDRSKEMGVSVGKDLRQNVRKAIEILANGFLKGEDLEPYKQSLDQCETLYKEVLTVIYRILFLLYAEQRGMIPSDELAADAKGDQNRIEVYLKEYSLKALRNRAESTRTGDDRNVDLWLGLKQTFRMLRGGREEMGIYSYNGELFSDEKTDLIDDYSCKNKHLLEAIRYLTLIERDGIKQRINFARIGVEEIGAIYENLLDYQPRVMDEREELDEGPVLPANKFVLDPRGTERKGSGSYYTHPNLVDQLIETALKPVVEDRLNQPSKSRTSTGDSPNTTPTANTPTNRTPTVREGANTMSRQQKIDALLDINVCDPACGSGAFLIKANNYLARVLARVRTGEEYPSDRELLEAKREVLQHCIYGVDLNPMAVELARVSLWINATVQDMPLNYLDHRIKVGNSLIGTLPDSIERGITQEHFSLQYIPEGDDREVVKELRKQCRKENKALEKARNMSMFEPHEIDPYHVSEIEDIPENTVQQISEKKERYAEYTNSDRYREQKFIHDLWTASFFWENTEEREWYPTPMNFREARNNPDKLPDASKNEIERLAGENKFFHWHLEFPEIFETDHPGFDCVLGNPPWGRIKLQEKKFFKGRNEDIVEAANKSERGTLINELREDDPALYQTFQRAMRSAECTSKFLRASGRYPYTGKGDINTYSVFAELDRDLINDRGRTGIVIPSGLATDKTTADFFRDLMEDNQVDSMYDFENSEGIFPEVHRSYKFSLLTLRGKQASDAPTDFAFFLTNLDHLQEDDRHFTLTQDELALLNPNTRTCPVFRSKRDAELTKKLYRQAPVLINEETGENPWGVSFLRMFDMSNDSHLFKTREELESEGFELDGNHFVKGDNRWLPLYEAKMFHQFDHRFGSFEDAESRTNVQLKNLTENEKADPERTVEPWYWVEEKEVKSIVNDDSYYITFRDIARTTDERTSIFSFIPFAGVGNNAPIFYTEKSVTANCLVLANLNSFIFDFVVRQKIGGTHMNFYLVKQLPVLTQDQYTENVKNYIVPRVVELTYSADDMKQYAQYIIGEIGHEKWNKWFPENQAEKNETPEPFEWNEERRFKLRSQLDAMYAHLYNVTEEELAYILDTFPIVKRHDEEEYGTYHTKEKILGEYQNLSECNAFGDEVL